MYQYKIFFKKDKIEYCGGQDRENSKVTRFWANEFRGKEFAYTIGESNNKTDKFTKGKDFDKLPLKNIQRLVTSAGFKF